MLNPPVITDDGVHDGVLTAAQLVTAILEHLALLQRHTLVHTQV